MKKWFTFWDECDRFEN